MNKTYNSKLTGFSQHLRKNMTKEEKHLWYDFLKELPVNVSRQKVFGDFIADFYIAKAKVIIELDGSQHYSEKGEQSDRVRDEYFAGLGIKVLRYTNLQIQREFDNVCKDILSNISNMEDDGYKPSP